MPDEVIADLSRCGGGAQALPLFSFSAQVLQPACFQFAASSFETHRFRDAPPAVTAKSLRRDEVREPSW
jgi:hypothetical protein